MFSSEVAIKITNLSKRYRIGAQKDSSLRASLSNLFKSKNSKKNDFWALKGLNFEIKKGDIVGIIGKNGAGKSTLLKILSQITAPTTGRIEINGRVASLLEVGTGFHPELTGRENIYLNGTILGMSRKEVKEKFDEIVKFSGVEQFIDTPVKHYSSGMYVRLAFAVAAHLEPEILIIDEVLAVGDADFQKKCLGKMKDVAGEGRTVLFVSHNMAAVKELCTKGVFIQNGQLKYIGNVEKTLEKYSLSDLEDEMIIRENNLQKKVVFKHIAAINSRYEYCNTFTWEDEILLKFEFYVNDNMHKQNVFVIIKDKYGAPVFSAEEKITSEKLILRIDSKFLVRGRYTITAFIHIPRVEQFDVLTDICMFTVTDASSPLAIHGSYDYGNVFGRYLWE